MAGLAVSFVAGANKNLPEKIKSFIDDYKKREQFKDVVFEILKDYGLNNSELANMLEIESRGTISKWLSGGPVSHDNLLKIADVFPTISLQRLFLVTAKPEARIRLMAIEKKLSINEQKEVFKELGFSIYEPPYQTNAYKKHKREYIDIINTIK